MFELFIYNLLAWNLLISSFFTFIYLLYKNGKYGRFETKGIDYKIGWIIMESFPVSTYLVCYFLGNRQLNTVALIFMGLFLGHYINRAFVYPFLTRGKSYISYWALFPAICLNTANGYLQGRWLNYFGPILSIDWLISPQFLIGISLFFCGLIINLHSDHILRKLRRKGKKEYKIPYGGVFRWVSCGNYFGEVIEWIGFAILTWVFGALVFAVFVFANLVPRARSYHRWYHERFPDYPKNRKAIFPYIY